MLKPIFEESEIKEVYITDEIRYIEFTHQAEYESCIQNFCLTKAEMLYYGEHRLEPHKWIIVIKETRKNE
jgi:hypothetical protein